MPGAHIIIDTGRRHVAARFALPASAFLFQTFASRRAGGILTDKAGRIRLVPSARVGVYGIRIAPIDAESPGSSLRISTGEIGCSRPAGHAPFVRPVDSFRAHGAG